MNAILGFLIVALFIAFIAGMAKPELFIKSSTIEHKRWIIFGVWFFASLLLSQIPSNGSSTDTVTDVDKEETPLVTVVPEDDNWTYTEERDEMTDKVTYTATCVSCDYTELKPPFDGQEIYLTMQCRQSAQYGKDVILSIPAGMFNLGVNGTKVKVRFDEGVMKTYFANGASDNSYNHLFIKNSSDFTNNLKQSKKVLVAVEFFDNGNFTYHFNTEGLKWNH